MSDTYNRLYALHLAILRDKSNALPPENLKALADTFFVWASKESKSISPYGKIESFDLSTLDVAKKKESPVVHADIDYEQQANKGFQKEKLIQDARFNMVDENDSGIAKVLKDNPTSADALYMEYQTHKPFNPMTDKLSNSLEQHDKGFQKQESAEYLMRHSDRYLNSDLGKKEKEMWLPSNSLELHMAELLSMDGWCDEIKMRKIYQLVTDSVKQFPIFNCIDIGAYAGRSFFPMALAMKDIGDKKNRAFALDAWNNTAPLEGIYNTAPNAKFWGKDVDMDKIYSEFVSHVKMFDVVDYTTIMRRHSHEAASYFEDGMIHFCHFDANHSSDIFLRDLELWTPKLAPNALVIFDDVGWKEMSIAYPKIPSFGYELVESFGTWEVWIYTGVMRPIAENKIESKQSNPIAEFVKGMNK